MGDLWCDLRGVAHWSQGRDCARADGGPVHGQTNQKGADAVCNIAFKRLEKGAASGTRPKEELGVEALVPPALLAISVRT